MTQKRTKKNSNRRSKRVSRKNNNHLGGSERVVTRKHKFPKKNNPVYLIENQPGLCVLNKVDKSEDKEMVGEIMLDIGDTSPDYKLHYIYRINKKQLGKLLKQCPGGLPTGIITIDNDTFYDVEDNNNEILREFKDCDPSDDGSCRGKCVGGLEPQEVCKCDKTLKKCYKKFRKCKADDDCPVRSTCNTSNGFCEYECENKIQCPPGHDCIKGKCTKISKVPAPRPSPPPPTSPSPKRTVSFRNNVNVRNNHGNHPEPLKPGKNERRIKVTNL